MIVKLLTEHHLEFLSLKGGCRSSSESTLIQMSNCWKFHAAAHLSFHMVLVLISAESSALWYQFLFQVWRIGIKSSYVWRIATNFNTWEDLVPISHTWDRIGTNISHMSCITIVLGFFLSTWGICMVATWNLPTCVFLSHVSNIGIKSVTYCYQFFTCCYELVPILHGVIFEGEKLTVQQSIKGTDENVNIYGPVCAVTRRMCKTPVFIWQYTIHLEVICLSVSLNAVFKRHTHCHINFLGLSTFLFVKMHFTTVYPISTTLHPPPPPAYKNAWVYSPVGLSVCLSVFPHVSLSVFLTV